MSSIGRSLDSYGSALFTNPLGVVQMGFKGYDLGLTGAGTTLKPDQDQKDIMAQQKGTKGYDKVRTGLKWILSCTLSTPSTEMFAVLFPGIFSSEGSVGNDSGTYKGNLYKSLVETEGGVLRTAALVDQCVSEDIQDLMNFYVAVPVLTAEILNWEADTQRAVAVDFEIYPYEYLDGAQCKSIHGYHGDPIAEGIPAAVWPDLEAPYIVSAAATLATEVVLTLNENATEIAGATSTERMVVKVDGVYVVPTLVVYATNTITLTLPAASILTTQIVNVSISEDTFEDGETVPNANVAINEFTVVNSL